MPRQKLETEVERKGALSTMVEDAPVIAYPSPSALSDMLKAEGVNFSRQAVRNYYLSVGIIYDKKTQLWRKEEDCE